MFEYLGSTVAEALSLLDENSDFDHAREEYADAFPEEAYARAIRALRTLRDALNG